MRPLSFLFHPKREVGRWVKEGNTIYVVGKGVFVQSLFLAMILIPVEIPRTEELQRI